MSRPRRRPAKLRTRRVDGHVIKFDDATSARMGRVRRTSTGPELTVRQALTAVGLRYRISNRDLPGSPDVANRSRHWAVFVHGCYWHRHEDCRRATSPKRNAEFWLAKFAVNRARDTRARKSLIAQGYVVLTIWECEAEQPRKLAATVLKFARRLQRRGLSRPT